MSSTEPRLAIAGLTKHFGTTRVLDGVDLVVPSGQVLAVIGASGSGKSTLLRCIDGLEDYESGSVHLGGERLTFASEGTGRRKLGDGALSSQRARIGFVFQAFNLFPHLTARQNITLGLRRVRRRPRSEADRTARQWLARVGLAERADHYPYQLSGGQQQRVAIARAFALEPELVLLDEVTSALDPELVGEVLAVIRDLARSGMTMIVVSHELAFVRDVADRIAFMNQGRVLEDGPPARLFAVPGTDELRAFLARFQKTAPSDPAVPMAAHP
jgi:polar amino acid transport system ATP-binding protein